MDRQPTSVRAVRSFCPPTLRAALITAVILAAGNVVYAQAPEPNPAPTVTTGSDLPAPNRVPDGSRQQITNAPANAEAPPASDTLAAALLPRDLSPWGMFLHADNLVKAVMIGLAFASVLTWTIALAKWLELLGFKARLRKAHLVIAARDR